MSSRPTVPSTLATMIYTLWCRLNFTLILASCGLLVLILPGLRWRQGMARRGMRLAWTLCGLRPTVTGLDNLPTKGAIVVANHASYLDGLLLMGVLPAGYVFVVKREMARVPLAGWLLRRVGTAFVERLDASQGARDTRSILRLAQNGTPLVFFPEGTIPATGLLGPFRLGAFLTAAQLDRPVVPVSLTGTAAVLPDDGRWRMFRAPLRVRIHPAIQPRGRQRSALAQLRDQARACIEGDLMPPTAMPYVERDPTDRHNG
jgi:1-acyl-sn-glycerol-3-phosphate acyltransferase